MPPSDSNTDCSIIRNTTFYFQWEPESLYCSLAEHTVLFFHERSHALCDVPSEMFQMYNIKLLYDWLLNIEDCRNRVTAVINPNDML
jgi:hypothetical protein